MCNIIQEPHTTLRKTADSVDVATIPSASFQKILKDMSTALHREPDGVALAAPQINISKRIFVVAGFVFDLKKKNLGGTPTKDKYFINPEIVKHSKETKWIPGEGCLSVRYVYGTAKRYKQATVRAYDEHGTLFTMSASGLLAQIFQHEIDHLDGILFIDHAKDIKQMTDEEIRDYQIELEHLRDK